MGIASFVLGVVAVVAIILLVVLAPILFSSALGDVNPQDLNPQEINQDSPVVVVAGLIGLGFLVSVLLTLLGLGLGIAGLVQRRRRKLFAAIGTALNGLVVLGVVALVVLSFALAGTA
ncbi:hypothetical protein GBA65_13995 [Rubrobacter marinus]|uniref:Uncharacterized protein n=1 Tax=Rubrobacter marinus TaxID=2653852 RepID=A0A6G8PZ42_9ACTN|nr:hypothetical protein [Rubrobacter marinus]QIN79440.1 hypothetical protein GBA65_13995 [Rubrobacter marinus]